MMVEGSSLVALWLDLQRDISKPYTIKHDSNSWQVGVGMRIKGLNQVIRHRISGQEVQ